MDWKGTFCPDSTFYLLHGPQQVGGGEECHAKYIDTSSDRMAYFDPENC